MDQVVQIVQLIVRHAIHLNVHSVPLDTISLELHAKQLLLVIVYNIMEVLLKEVLVLYVRQVILFNSAVVINVLAVRHVVFNFYVNLLLYQVLLLSIMPVLCLLQ